MTSDNTSPGPAPEQIPLPQLFPLVEHHAANQVPYDVHEGLAKLTAWMAEDVDEASGARQDAELAHARQPTWSQVAHAGLSASPQHRTIVVVDVEGSTTRTNPGRAQLRHVLFELLDEALRDSGVDEHRRDPFVDRGDGALVLIRPVDEVPKTLLLTSIIPTLTRVLAEYNTAAQPGHEIRLRVAVHAGEIHYDSHGLFGEDLDIACRLVDSPTLKRALRHAHTPLVLAASNTFYRAVIRHNYDGIDPNAFKRDILIKIGGQRMEGWINYPGADSAKKGRHLTA